METAKHSSDIKTFIIQLYGFRHIEREAAENGFYFVSLTEDNVVDSQHLLMVLCGQCSTGWFKFTSNVNPALISCYTLELTECLVSHDDAAAKCSALKSRLVAMETAEEYDYVTHLITNNVMRIFQDTHLGPYVIHIGQCDVRTLKRQMYLHWESLRPVTFGKMFLNRTSPPCSAMEFYYNKSFVTENGIFNVSRVRVHFNYKITRLVVCEMNLEMRQLTHDLSEGEQKPFTVATKKAVKDVYAVSNQSDRFFQCKENEGVVMYSFVCDGHEDCPNGRDEYMCFGMEICGMDYPCSDILISDFCYDEVERCDGIPHCPNKKDEEDCNECMETSSVGGTCLPSQWFDHDGKPHGKTTHFLLNITNSSGKAENCKSDDCIFSFFPETFISACENEDVHDDVSVSQALNVEKNSPLRRYAPRCVHLKGRYSKTTLGCTNLSHLDYCENYTCSVGLFKCRESFCIPFYMLHDGVADCPHKEDEDDVLYLKGSESNIFECRDSSVSIHPVHVCDGQKHCPTGDDELNCFKKCPVGFTCQNGVSAVTDPSRVDYKTSLASLDPTTRVLDLSGLNISHLHFPRNVHLIKLFEIHLSNCSLTFKTLVMLFNTLLSGLKSIYLVNASLSTITPELVVLDQNVYYALSHLRFLYLSGADVKLFFIETLFLDSGEPMEVIDLSFVAIETFTFRTQVKYLNLSYTNVQKLEYHFDTIHDVAVLDLRKTNLSFNFKTVQMFTNLAVSSAIYLDNFKFCCEEIRGPGIPADNCLAPVDSVSSCDHLLGDVVKRCLLWFVALTGSLGNVLVVVKLIYKKTYMKKGNACFLLNLCLSDLVMGVYLILVAGVDVYYRDNYLWYDTQWRDSYLCHAAGFSVSLSYQTSALFVCLLVVDRCAVFYKRHDKNTTPKCLLVACVVGVWVLGIVMSSLPVLNPEWQIFSLNAMCLDLSPHVNHYTGWAFAFSAYIISRCILTILILTGFIFFVKLILFPSHSDFDISVSEIKVTKHVLLVAVSNILCWLPVCIIGLMSGLGHVFAPDTHGWLIMFVVPLNSATNPLFYITPDIYALWKDFKNGLHRT